MYSNHNDPKQTIASSACGPAAFSIVVSTLNRIDVPPTEMCRYALAKGFRTYDSGTDSRLFTTAASDSANPRYNLNYTYVSGTSSAKSLLSDGKHLVIASMGYGHVTRQGHYIVLAGTTVVNGKTYFKVYDPHRWNEYYIFDNELIDGTPEDGFILLSETAVRNEAKGFWGFSNKNNSYINSGSSSNTSNGQTVSNISERVVISGSEYYSLVGEYKKRFKYNFIEPAINELTSFAKNYPNDKITWIISRTDYTSTDLANFKDTARRISPRINVVFIDIANEVINYMNSNRTSCKIGNLTVFAHGVPGSVELGYRQENAINLSLGLLNLKNIKQSSFKSNAYTVLYSCNGATPVKSNGTDAGVIAGLGLEGKNLAEEWFKLGFGIIKAALGKTDYKLIFGDDIDKHVADRSSKGYCESGAVKYPAPTAEGAKWVIYQ